jgi:acetoin:2,6-dichlorophenolindophenol oxidoreductase subunit alpha
MDRALQLYRTMARIRAFENAAEEASKGGVAVLGAALTQANIRGPLHLSTGQEAVAAGVCLNLDKHDYLTSTHRGHGHTLAKGASMDAMMAELFGRATGPNRGKGGSMHLADFSVGMLGANGVVAAGMPIAVGAAHAVKIRKQNRIVACFFGDGAVNRGPFLEALNWAAIHALPVLFVCEDNRWSATTPTDAMTAGEGALARAAAIGVPGKQVDGNDVFAVDAVTQKLVAEVKVKGPRFLHAITYRFKGHVSVDAAAYRDGTEVSRALQNDPLVLALQKIPQSEAAKITQEAEREVARALDAAANGPWPDTREAYRDVQDSGFGQWR